MRPAKALPAAALVAASAVLPTCSLSKAVDKIDDKVEARFAEIERRIPKMAAAATDKAMDRVDESVSHWIDWLKAGALAFAAGYAAIRTKKHASEALAKKREAAPAPGK